MRTVKNIMKTIKNIVKMFDQAVMLDKGFIFVFILYTVLSSLANIILLYIPKFSAELVGANFKNVNLLYLTALAIVLTAIFEFGSEWMFDIFNSRIFPIRFGFIGKLSEKFSSLDYCKIMQEEYVTKGSFAFNAMKSNDVGVQCVLREIFVIFSSLLSIILATGILSNLHISIVLLCVIFAVVSFVLQKERDKLYFKFAKDRVKLDNRVSNSLNLLYDIRYGKELRMYDTNKLILNQYSSLMKEQRKRNNRNNLKFQIFNICGVILDKGKNICIYFVLIYLYFQSNMSLGDFILFIGASTELSLWLKNFIIHFSAIANNGRYINEYYDFLSISDESSKTEELHVDHVKDMTIEFRDVSFRYPESNKYVLQNVSLTIHNGDTVALAGLNGAGKTTFIYLLMRLYEPTEGAIFLNGVNINRYYKKEYWTLINPLFQDFNIFAFDIRQNVSLKTKKLTDDQKVEKALGKINLLEKIKQLPTSTKTMLTKEIDSDGLQFSGGESQRLAFARTLYRDNSLLLILDEPSASLDPLAEADLYKEFKELSRGKTSLFISHRFASVSFCDYVIFLNDGKVSEIGTHKELIEKNGTYAELYKIQSDFFHSK